jgi:hypothetical protein
MDDNSLLKDVLESYFTAGVEADYDEIRQYLNNPDFPARARNFKSELADAILNHKVTPEEFEEVTAVDQDSQSDVDRFLTTEIWNPLYNNEPVRQVR